MIIPLGPATRRLLPVVTLALILANFAVFFLTLPRVAHDAIVMAVAGSDLQRLSMEIEFKHRGYTRVMRDQLDLQADIRSADTFWWRWKNGLIVPTWEKEWQDWDAARVKAEAAQRETLFYQYGLRRKEPTLAGLLAHGFLHAGLGHVFFNMLFLWSVGAPMEEAWGRKWFGLLYAVGLFGAVLGDFAFLKADSDVPGIGASGAVAGVMGAMLVRNFKTPIRIFSVFPIPNVYRVAAGWLLIPWIAGEMAALGDARDDGVGYWAHVAGFASGAALAALLRLGGEERREIEPVMAAERRRHDREKLLAEADERRKHLDDAGALEKVRAAVAVDPEDLPTRRRLLEQLGACRDRAGQAAEGMEVLALVWRSGDRPGYLALFRWLELETGAPLPGRFAHKAAWVLESQDPVGAARLYERALREAPDDPLADRSLERFAILFDRMGRAEEAAQVRALREARRRERRDSTLG